MPYELSRDSTVTGLRNLPAYLRTSSMELVDLDRNVGASRKGFVDGRRTQQSGLGKAT
jgi:hypothetical protein